MNALNSRKNSLWLDTFLLAIFAVLISYFLLTCFFGLNIKETANCAYAMDTNNIASSKIKEMEEPTELNIMTYNMGHYDFGQTDHYGIPAPMLEQKTANIKKLFKELDCDIVGIQEFYRYTNTPDQSPRIEANEMLFNRFFPYCTDTSSWTSIKSKFPLQNDGFDRLNTNGRGYSYGEILVGNKKIFLLSVHFTPGRTAEAQEIRMAEAEEVLSMARKHDRYIIFGDFNTQLESYKDLYKVFTNAGAKAANCGEFGDYWTTCDSKDMNYNFEHYNDPRGNLYYIDNIIVSSNIEICDAKPINVYHDSISDHIPFFATVRI